MNRKIMMAFALGSLAGGLVGGVAGYVMNDLTSRPNEATVEAIRQAEATQANLDDFFDQLATQPPQAGSGAGR